MFLHLWSPFKSGVLKHGPVDRGHFQIVIMLMQGTPSVVTVVKVMVFVGTEIKGYEKVTFVSVIAINCSSM